MDQCPIQEESKTLIRLTLQKREISARSMGHQARKAFSQLASFLLLPQNQLIDVIVSWISRVTGANQNVQKWISVALVNTKLERTQNMLINAKFAVFHTRDNKTLLTAQTGLPVFLKQKLIFLTHWRSVGCTSLNLPSKFYFIRCQKFAKLYLR